MSALRGPRCGDLKVPERNPLLLSLRRREVDAASDRRRQDTADGCRATRAASADQSGVSPFRGNGRRAVPKNFSPISNPMPIRRRETLGMDTSVLLAQSALETGWGKHVPRRADGRSSFNLFGIKADRSWEGDKVCGRHPGISQWRGTARAGEVSRLRRVRRSRFIDYVAFLRRNPRYRGALASTTGEDFIRGLQQAGYATDPSYASKILGIRDRLERLSASAETQVSTAQADTKAEG